jgi:hypothetical protein
MTDQLHRLVDVATGQHGAIAPYQAELVGVTKRELRRRVQSGVLHQTGVHVVRSPFVEATPLADLAALVLDCGPRAVASGRTAAALHELDGFVLAPPFHVTIQRGRSIERAGHHIHTTAELPAIDCVRVHGVPTMTVERDLIDLARSLRPKPLTAALDSALRDQLTTEPRLHCRIAALRASGRYGIPALLAVIEGTEITRGAHSWLERRFLELCADSGLPRPVPQVVLATARDRIVRVDFSFPSTPVVIEVLGYRYHRTPSQLARDAERLNSLVMNGKQPLQFTYDHVTLEPEWVAVQVATALEPFASAV